MSIFKPTEAEAAIILCEMAHTEHTAPDGAHKTDCQQQSDASAATESIYSEVDGEELTAFAAAATLCMMRSKKISGTPVIHHQRSPPRARHVDDRRETNSLRGDHRATSTTSAELSTATTNSDTPSQAVEASFSQSEFDVAMRFMMQNRPSPDFSDSDEDDEMDGRFSTTPNNEASRLFEEAGVETLGSSSSSSSPTDRFGSSLNRHSRSRRPNNNQQFVYQRVVRLTRAERTAQAAANKEAHKARKAAMAHKKRPVGGARKQRD